MKVYAFLYCSCIYESSPETISLHFTKVGAYRAMRQHRVAECVRHRECGFDSGKWPRKYDAHQWWGIQEMKVKA